jgi:hypothetical protein
VTLAEPHRNLAAASRRRLIAWKKEHAYRYVFHRPVSYVFGLSAKKLQRQLREEAGSVSGAAVSIEGSAMGQIAESLERGLNDVVGCASGDIGDKSDPARIVLVEWVVQ